MARVWFVIVEPDGDKMPTTYYNRLHDLGIYTPRRKREDKSIGLDVINEKRRIVNALGADIGVVVQEGCVIASDASLINEVAMLAKVHGAKSVVVGSGDVFPFTPSKRATEIFNNIQGVLGKTGRSEAPSDWSVTCSVELNTWLVEKQKSIIQCPSCGSPNILVRRGKPMRIKVDPNDQILRAWARSRFATSVIEMSQSTDELVSPPPFDILEDLADEEDWKFLKKIETNKELVRFLESLTPNKAVLYLDGIYISRRMRDTAERQETRVDAAIAVYQAGFSPEDYPLIESDVPDVLDALSSAIIPSDIAFDLLGYKRANSKNNKET